MRMPPSQNRFNRRTQADYALAARMLLRLKKGEDLRTERVLEVKAEMESGALDNDLKLDRAMDILINELESEIEAAEIDQAEVDASKQTPPMFVQVKCLTPLRRRRPAAAD